MIAKHIVRNIKFMLNVKQHSHWDTFLGKSILSDEIIIRSFVTRLMLKDLASASLFTMMTYERKTNIENLNISDMKAIVYKQKRWYICFSTFILWLFKLITVITLIRKLSFLITRYTNSIFIYNLFIKSLNNILICFNFTQLAQSSILNSR